MRTQKTGAARSMGMTAGVLLVLAGGIGGCGNKARTEDAPKDDRPVLRAAPSPRNEKADELSQAAMDLQEGLNLMRDRGAEDGAAAPAENPAQPGQSETPRSGRSRSADPVMPEQPEATGGTAVANTTAEVPAANEPVAAKETKSSKTPSQKRAATAGELAEMLTPDIQAAKEPLKAALPLFGVDLASSGAASSQIDLIMRSVTPEQRRSLAVAQDLLKTMAGNTQVASGDQEAMARLLREKADELASAPRSDALTLGTVALCRRVEGFGRYAPMETTTFVVGKPISFIVYTEVENFTKTRSAAESDAQMAGWAVELGQEIRLHLDSDGTEQMVIQEQPIKDVSRSARRDFYIVQRVDLPRTLSVGQYNLKIKVRDIASGAIAEHVVPVRLVADASAARTQR